MIDRDAPLRLSAGRPAARALDRRAVRRQLGISLWLLTTISVALGGVVASRPTVAAQQAAAVLAPAAR